MTKAFSVDEKIKLATEFGTIFEITSKDYPFVMRANVGVVKDFSITICQLDGVSDNVATFYSFNRHRADMEEKHVHYGDLDQTIQEMQDNFEDYSIKIVAEYTRKLNALKADIATVGICENGMDNITMFEGHDKALRYCTGVNVNTSHTYIIIDNPYYIHQSYLISWLGQEMTNRYIEMNNYNDVIFINLPRKEYEERNGNIDDILEQYK